MSRTTVLGGCVQWDTSYLGAGAREELQKMVADTQTKPTDRSLHQLSVVLTNASEGRCGSLHFKNP